MQENLFSNLVKGRSCQTGVDMSGVNVMYLHSLIFQMKALPLNQMNVKYR